MATLSYVTPLSNAQLSLLIDQTRNHLADVPEEMLEVVTIYDSLKRANKLVAQVAISQQCSVAYQKECVIATAAMFSYQSYVALASRRTGNVPDNAAEIIASLRSSARALIHVVADRPFKADFTQDTEFLSKMKVTAIHGLGGVLRRPCNLPTEFTEGS